MLTIKVYFPDDIDSELREVLWDADIAVEDFHFIAVVPMKAMTWNEVHQEWDCTWQVEQVFWFNPNLEWHKLIFNDHTVGIGVSHE